ncbi:hypothetical protein HY375_00305 [Candidatus Berkelbacteria bacterium]|nr:hypothetical protein [Candidatus Berkelbacteria bacterium]
MTLAIIQMVQDGRIDRQPLTAVRVENQPCQRSMAWTAALAAERCGYLVALEARRVSRTLFELTYERPYCHGEWRVRRVRIKRRK